MRPFLLLALVACGSSTPSTETTPGGGSRSEAVKAARDTLLEAYSSLRRGDVDGFQAIATQDVFVVGPGAGDVFVTRTDAVVALSGAFSSGSSPKKHRVESQGLQVSAAPSGRSAWAVDRVDLDGVPYHVTAILVETDEIWQISAVHVGRATGAPEKPKPPAALVGGVGPRADPVASRFRAGLADPEKFLDQFDDRQDVVFLGPSTKDISKGPKAIKKTWKKLLKRKPKMSAQGDLRAAVTPDGTLGWIVANVEVVDESGEKLEPRFAAVYVNGGKEWRLVSMQAAFGAP